MFGKDAGLLCTFLLHLANFCLQLGLEVMAVGCSGRVVVSGPSLDMDYARCLCPPAGLGGSVETWDAIAISYLEGSKREAPGSLESG